MRIVPTDSSNVKQYRSLVDALIRVIESGRVTAARVVNQAMTTGCTARECFESEGRYRRANRLYI